MSQEFDNKYKKPTSPGDLTRAEFTVAVKAGVHNAWINRLLKSGALVEHPEASGSSSAVQHLKLILQGSGLQESTPGQPLLRHQYPDRFFEERILRGYTMLPQEEADYQLETHPIHACCFESSRVAPLVERIFPQIADPVICNLVASLMVTSSATPSLESFNACFRSPLVGITQAVINDAYNAIQDARPSRGVILRNSLATFESTRARSRREVREMGDPEYNPRDDFSDKFNVRHVLDEGITITVKRDVLADALGKIRDSDACPHAEKLKLEKLFAVAVDDRPLSDGSKLALSAHDTFDHMFFFDVIHRLYLADAFLPRIANFDFSTRDNIFSMPSEYIAMVPYDWRAWQEMGMSHNRPVQPILDTARETLRLGLGTGLLPEESIGTIQEFLALSNEHEFAQQCGFTLRGILWENGEMAIKWGSLDLRPNETVNSSHTEPWGPTPILQHPAYVGFVICGLKELNNPQHRAVEVLQKINYTLEYHLAEAIEHYGRSDQPYTFNLKIAELRDDAAPNVPLYLREWFKEHIGFAAVRAPLCD